VLFRSGGFRQRAEQTYRLLQEPGTAFLVVAAPEPDALREASYFVERLASESMPLAGLVLNRVSAPAQAPLSAERALTAAEDLDALGGHRLVAALLRVHAQQVRRRERELALTARFTGAHPRVPVALAWARGSDVHDLGGLRSVGGDLATARIA
jgi:anion-transporting  ArsA/GET3 family ATPase